MSHLCLLTLQNILQVELPLVTGRQGRLQQAQQRRQRGGEKQTQNQIQNCSASPQSQTWASSPTSSQERSSTQAGDSQAQSGSGRVPVALEGILDEPEASKVLVPEGQGGQSPNPRIHNHRAPKQGSLQTDWQRSGCVGASCWDMEQLLETGKDFYRWVKKFLRQYFVLEFIYFGHNCFQW